MQKSTKSKDSKGSQGSQGETIKGIKQTVAKSNEQDFIQLPTREEHKANTDQLNNPNLAATTNHPQTVTITNAIGPLQPPSKIDDQPSSLSRQSNMTLNVNTKSQSICPPALRDRGYEINEEIGGGAFSKVYKAKYRVLFEKEIAVKVISLDKVPEVWREKCLKQELKILRKLQHPHIIKVWDIIKTRRNVFIFMDLAENNSILHYLHLHNKPIVETTARLWFVQTTGAISYMHSKVKNENILLDRDYNAKITDFGFSCFTYDKESRQALMAPTCCGTVAYIAPEVLNPPYEARIADIWSLGVCLFEMVTFQKPFDETQNQKKLYKAQINRDYRYPPAIEFKLSDDLKDLISKMLEPDPEQRLTANQILSHQWVCNQWMRN